MRKGVDGQTVAFETGSKSLGNDKVREWVLEEERRQLFSEVMFLGLQGIGFIILWKVK